MNSFISFKAMIPETIVRLMKELNGKDYSVLVRERMCVAVLVCVVAVMNKII